MGFQEASVGLGGYMCNNRFYFKGIPLIKFQSRDKIESLQNGLLYAKSLSYYNELEETGDKQVGDSYEGELHIANGAIFDNMGNKVCDLTNIKLKNPFSSNPVFCMYCAPKGISTLSFTEVQKDKFKNFGDTALVIFNNKEFERRVRIAAERENIKMVFQRVQYYDPKYNDYHLLMSIQNKLYNIVFWKRDIYKYQQEARMLFITDSNVKDHIILDIGSIKDISLVIDTKELLENSYILIGR